MTRAFGDGTFGSGTFGDTSAANIALARVAATVSVPTPTVLAVRNQAITTTTLARSVVIPLPKIILQPDASETVAGGDILYLTARYAPSIVLVARRGSPKVASHRPAMTRKASHGTIRKQATASQPIP